MVLAAVAGGIFIIGGTGALDASCGIVKTKPSGSIEMKRKPATAPKHSGPALMPPYDRIAATWPPSDRHWLHYALQRRAENYAAVFPWAEDRGRANCMDLIRAQSVRAWRLIVQSPAAEQIAGPTDA